MQHRSAKKGGIMDNDDFPDDTGQKQGSGNAQGSVVTQFKPGQSGNYKGRTRGSRSKLSEQFLSDVYEAWGASGKEALNMAIETKPMEFCKMIAGLLPRELNVSTSKFDHMTDEQLVERLRVLDEQIRPILDGGFGRPDKKSVTH